MTKNLSSSNPPLTSELELDLDSFLKRHNAATSSSDENSGDDHRTSDVHHRTVDDILNESSSDSENDGVSAVVASTSSMNSTQFKYNLIQRMKSDDLNGVSVRKPPQNLRSSSAFGSGGGVSRKPGAAFAAASAASRSVRRRAFSVSLEGKVFDGDDLLGFGKDDVKSESSNGVIEEREISAVEKIDEKGGGGSGGDELEVNEFGSVKVSDSNAEKAEVMPLSEEKSEVGKVNSEEFVENEVRMEERRGDESDDGKEIESSSNFEEETIVEKKDDHMEERRGYESDDGKEGGLSLEEVDNGKIESHEVKKSVGFSDDDGLVVGRDESSSVGDDDVMELVEDSIVQLESESDGVKVEEKLEPPKKALEVAEELEIKQASTGQDWEEGAAAQPMRLEGVRRGSTVLGYFDVNADNIISRTIKSQAFIRDYGNPQAIAVHLNYIALAMSKGVVVVVPSKYSAQHPDNMDPKMLLLGAQADRSQAPVTSICFNQQGDLLLAGYGDGHITLWNLPRGTVAKIISGEHSAPVVHTLFLGQDSQVTRQFKVVSGDGKGLVLLHEFSSVPLLGFSVKTQCILDGQRTEKVLCASPLLPDEFVFSGNTTTSANNTGAIGGGATSWKLFNEGSSLSEEGVVIFVTHQTALVVRLSPSLEVYAKFSKPEGVRDGSMPYTAWKCTTQSRGSSSDNMNPEALERISLLAIAWDRKVQVAKLVKSDSKKSELKESVKPELKESGKWTLRECGKWTLESAAVGLVWLDDQMLVILTAAGQLCLFTRDGTLIHQTSYAIDGNVGDDRISYHTYFTNVFGNPEKAYQNSLCIRGASIYILAPRHVVVSRLLLWRERIEVLRNAGDWMGAFSMAMALYDGQTHGVIDLPRDLQSLQAAIVPYMVELLYSYVDEVFSYISVACFNQSGKIEGVDGSLTKSNSSSSEIKEQFTRVGGVAVEFCAHIRRTDILFNDIYSKFVAVQHRDTFLELLEPYILKDMLGSLPPEIMQALVEHYNSKGWLQRVEQCVLHMDISSLDFNQVVRLCRESGLYGALIYLFNKGLDDFKTPLEELLSVLRNCERDATAAAVGYRMLVYLKYCFSGLAFPPGHGKLPTERLPSLRIEILQFLLQDSGGPKSQTGASLTSTGAYLNLHYLLELDTESTLDVLRIAFDEDENVTLDKTLLNSSDANVDHPKDNDSSAYDKNILVQKTVDALVIVLDIDISQSVRSAGSEDTGEVVWPSKKDIGQLIDFVASYVACKRANVSKSVLSQILEYFTSENYFALNDGDQKNETKKKGEKKVLSLLDAVPQTEWNTSYVLHLCEKAQFHQVCGLIHTIKHDYLAALDNYMKDVDEPVHAFAFLDGIMLQLSESESAAFLSSVISRIPELIILSRECTFFLVSSHLNKEKELVLSKLQSAPKSLFLYLKTLFEVYISGTLNFSCVRVDYVLDGPWGRHNHGKACLDAYLERISEFPKIIRNNPIEVTNDLIELYLELLCQYESDSVLKFLETVENYRVDRCLRLCQEYGVVDAAAFLLERVGDVGSAMLLTLSGLNEKFVLLGMAVESLISDKRVGKPIKMDYFAAASGLKEIHDIKKILHACIGLCQRNTPRLDIEESESLWFHLLDSFCKPLLISQGNSDKGTSSQSSSYKDNLEVNDITWRVYMNQKCSSILKELFSQFVKDIVEGMIGFVRLPSIMGKLLADNGSQEFGDFKLTILGILGRYTFERRILDTAKCLIEDDTFYTMNLLKKGASKGYAPRSLECCICNCSFKSSSNSGIQVFNCGHATHLHCEVQDTGTSSQSSLSGCPICVPKKKIQKAKGKMTDQGLISTLSSTSQRTHGSGIMHAHELDAFDNSIGPQLSRFEILNSLQKNQRLISNNTMPQLRLAPPTVYHEKVNKRNHFSPGASSGGLMDAEKPSRNRQLRDLKVKSPQVRFPLKSKIFGKEKTRVN